MKLVPLSTLQDRIVRPGFEKHLRPLLMYRGALTLGRAHRLWNTIIAAMEQEATASDITQRLTANPDFSHLCGIERALAFSSLRSFCGRLTDNPKVMAEMPGLEEYLDWLILPYQRLGSLTRVSEIAPNRRSMGAGGWRYYGPRPRVHPHKTSDITYPFLIHDGGKPEHTLLRRVTAAVRTHNLDLRADLCQDLIVGILAGEFAEDDLALPAREVAKRAAKLYPDKYRAVSLDEEIFGDGKKTWLDSLADEGRDWA